MHGFETDGVERERMLNGSGDLGQRKGPKQAQHSGNCQPGSGVA